MSGESSTAAFLRRPCAVQRVEAGGFRISIGLGLLDDVAVEIVAVGRDATGLGHGQQTIQRIVGRGDCPRCSAINGLQSVTCGIVGIHVRQPA